MLHNRTGPSRLRRNALNLTPGVTSILGFVYAAASGCNHMVRIARINVDGEDVGIINDPVLDRFPRLAAVGGLVRQVPGPRVNDIRGTRIDRQRLDMYKT